MEMIPTKNSTARPSNTNVNPNVNPNVNGNVGEDINTITNTNPNTDSGVNSNSANVSNNISRSDVGTSPNSNTTGKTNTSTNANINAKDSPKENANTNTNASNNVMTSNKTDTNVIVNANATKSNTNPDTNSDNITGASSIASSNSSPKVIHPITINDLSNSPTEQPFCGLQLVAPHTGGPIHSNSINVNDVLCGRGTAHRTHSGNRRYHMLVKHFEPEYSKALTKDDKTKISRAIVAAVRNAKWAGRFLQKDENEEFIWYELGDRKAWEKTSQLLREYVAMGQFRTAYQSRKLRKDDEPYSSEDGKDDILGMIDFFGSMENSPSEHPQSPLGITIPNSVRTSNVGQSLQSPPQQVKNQQTQQRQAQQTVQHPQQIRQTQHQGHNRYQQQQQKDKNNSSPHQTLNIKKSSPKMQNHQKQAGASTKGSDEQRETNAIEGIQGCSITTPNIDKIFLASSSTTTGTNNKRAFKTINGNVILSKLSKKSRREREGKSKKIQHFSVSDSACVVTKADMDVINATKSSFSENLKKEIALWSCKPSQEVMGQLQDISRRYNAQVAVYSQMSGSHNSTKD